MDPGAIPDLRPAAIVAGSEENGTGKDPFECVRQSAVVFTVGGQSPLIQDLSGAFKFDDRALFAYRLGGQPESRSWPNGTPNSGCPTISRKKRPFRRV
jgi:hypothetical protein